MEDALSSGDLTEDVVLKHLQLLAGIANVDLADRTKDEIIAYARARAIGSAIDSCVEAFKQNYAAIMDGSFSDSLVGTSTKSEEFGSIETISKKLLFTSTRKTELEVFGRNTVHKIFDGLVGIFDNMLENNWDSSKLSGYNEQLWRATKIDLRDAKDPYSALHAMTDYVSGMTDRYAVKVAKLLAGT